MNKILIVGHHFSGFEYVLQLLIESGMRHAIPTRRDGASPADVDEMLCKSCGIQSSGTEPYRFEHPVRQLEISSIWNGLATDLLWANAAQPFWGWADPSAVYLLNFWKTAVPDMMFVLVFNHPRTALYDTLDGDLSSVSDLDDTLLDSAKSSWRAYNEALLGFYRENSDRCLLVNSEQTVSLATSDLKKLRSLLGEPLQTGERPQSNALLAQADEKTESEKGSINSDDSITYRHDERLQILPFPVSEMPGEMVPAKIGEIALVNYLAESVSTQWIDEQNLYEEMQSSATLPVTADMAQESNATLVWEAFRKMVMQGHRLYRSLKQSEDALFALEADREMLRHQRDDSIEEGEVLLDQLALVQESLEEKILEGESIAGKIDMLARDNELMSAQLREVRAELSVLRDENKNFRENHPSGAAQRVQQELPYLIGASILKQARSLWQLVFMPWILLGVALRYRKAQKQKTESLPPIEAYRDFNEGKKMRQHLSYLLGCTWLYHIHKPWNFIVLPWALFGAYAKFRKLKKKKRTR